MPDTPSPLHLRGLVAAAFTPLNADAQPDLDRIPAVVDHLAGHGIAGIYVLGTTGEGPSFTEAERRTVAEAYVAAAKARGIPSLIQVGSESIGAARGLAEHAQSVGADAISAVPPTDFKPDSAAHLVEIIAGIAAGAPDLPFYYYHIPALSKIEVDPVELAKLGAEAIPNFAGIKFSEIRFFLLQPMQAAAPDCEFLSGSDECYLMTLAQGWQSAIGSTYNFSAPLYRRVEDAFAAGDWEAARLWQHRAQRVIDALFAECGRAGLKTMMKMVGVDCGPARLPQRQPTPAQEAALRARLESMGFYDWMGIDSPS
ncbi:MAG: dihydrodipicolinate synthase family protein [Verrucomicrobiales bacterium]